MLGEESRVAVVERGTRQQETPAPPVSEWSEGFGISDLRFHASDFVAFGVR